MVRRRARLRGLGRQVRLRRLRWQAWAPQWARCSPGLLLMRLPSQTASWGAPRRPRAPHRARWSTKWAVQVQLPPAWLRWVRVRGQRARLPGLLLLRVRERVQRARLPGLLLLLLPGLPGLLLPGLPGLLLPGLLGLLLPGLLLLLLPALHSE